MLEATIHWMIKKLSFFLLLLGGDSLSGQDPKTIIPEQMSGVGIPLSVEVFHEKAEVALTFDRRADYEFQGMSFVYETSPNLEEWFLSKEIDGFSPNDSETVLWSEMRDDVQVDHVRALVDDGNPITTPAFYRIRVLKDMPEAWRAEAYERINLIRKSDLSITVTDDEENPIEGARVRIKLSRHKFLWGAVVNTHWTTSPYLDKSRKHS